MIVITEDEPADGDGEGNDGEGNDEEGNDEDGDGGVGEAEAAMWCAKGWQHHSSVCSHC